MHDRIFTHPQFESDIQLEITEACILLDNEFLDKTRNDCGTTALGVLMRGSKLTVFNIGDGHAVICSAGVSVDMSDPHKPGRSDEEARIKAAHGWITEEKELYMGRLHRMDLSDPLVRDKAQQVSWVTIHRVCGELAVSRSIGDPAYKRFVPGRKVTDLFNWLDGHGQSFDADLVIPIPEFKTFDIGPGDEFIILASDGLWDVVSGSDAVSRTRAALKQGKGSTEAAEELCDLALKLGSSDNVTIVVVVFIHPT